MAEFEAYLSEFKERVTTLTGAIILELEDLKNQTYGCKARSVSARNKLKDLIEMSKKLKSSSLVKSKSLPKRNVIKKGDKKDTPTIIYMKDHTFIDIEDQVDSLPK